MADEGGIFIDIFARLNMASVENALSNLTSMMSGAGKKASEAFEQGTAGFDRAMAKYQTGMRSWMREMDGIDRQMERSMLAHGKQMEKYTSDMATYLGPVMDRYKELSATVDSAYSKMVRDAAAAQTELARIDELMAASAEGSARRRALASARKAEEATAATSAKRYEDALADYAAYAPPRPRRPEEPEEPERPDSPRPPEGRGQAIPMSRGVSRAGGITALATGGIAAGSLDIAGRSQAELNRILTLKQDSAGNVGQIQQGVYRLAQQTGFSPKDLSEAAELAERAGYRGADVNTMLEQSAMMARVGGTSLKDSMDALTTSANDAGISALRGDGNQSSEKFSKALIPMTGQMAISAAQNKGDFTDWTHALHSIEPTAQAFNIPLAQIWGMMDQASQTGQSNQQTTQNLSRLVYKFGAPQGPSKAALDQVLAQSGMMGPDGKPITSETIAQMTSSGQFLPAMNTVFGAIDKSVGPDGMFRMDPHRMDNILKGNEQEVYGQLTPDVQKLANSDVMQMGLTNNWSVATMMKKAREAGQLGDIDPSQEEMLKEWLTIRHQENGISPALAKGLPQELTKEQIGNLLFGTGDIMRTANILAGTPTNLQQTNQRVQTAEAGDPTGLKDMFEQWKTSLAAKFQLLGGSLESLAGALGQNLIPAATHMVNGLNDIVDFFSKFKGLGATLLAGMAAVTAMWATIKAVNFIADFIEAMGMAKEALSVFGGGLRSMLPNLGVIQTGAEELGAAETAAGGEIAAAGTAASGEIEGAGATAATEIEGGATALAGEEAAAGTGLEGALTAAGAAAAAEIEGGAGAFAATLGGIGAAEILGVLLASGAFAGLAIEGVKYATDYKNDQQLWDETPGWDGKPRQAPKLDRYGNAPLDPVKDAGSVGELMGGAPDSPAPRAPDRPGAQMPSSLTPILHPGMAKGGILGFWDGGETPEGEQPLMDVPDAGGDSVLGALPDGSLVGLRGHEGILTPEAVEALGGKSAIDALNAGHVDLRSRSGKGVYKEPKTQGNPWDDPTGVGLTFFGSFAQGVAKYSPFGKPLTAISSSLNDMVRGGEEGERGGEKGRKGPDPSTHRGLVEIAHKVYKALGLPDDQWTDMRSYLNKHDAFDPAKLPQGADPASYYAQMFQQVLSEHGSAKDAWDQQKAYDKQHRAKRGHRESHSGGGIVGFGGGNSDVPPAPNGPSITDFYKGLSGGGPPKPQGAAPDPWGLGPGSRTPPKQGPPGSPLDDLLNSGPKPPAPPKTKPEPPPPKQPPSHSTDAKQALSPQRTPQGETPQPEDRKIEDNPSRPFGTENESKGFGVGGGLIGAAEGAASAAGGPLGAAAQPAFQLINRAIGYAGQLVGIGMTGLMETFLPNNSELADPSKNIFGKVAFGIAGAHPTPQNSAGGSAMQLNPKQDLDQGAQAGKQVNLHMPNATIHNHGVQDMDGMSKSVTEGTMGNYPVAGH